MRHELVRIATHVCPTKFLYVRQSSTLAAEIILQAQPSAGSQTAIMRALTSINITITVKISRHWMPSILLGSDGSGYTAIPDSSYDFVILHHVVEHMTAPAQILATVCSKLKPGGYIWIAVPSLRSLSLPPAHGTLQFCDDPTHVTFLIFGRFRIFFWRMGWRSSMRAGRGTSSGR